MSAAPIEILASLPYNTNPEDSYLRLVLHRAQHKADEWVTHVQNLQTGGFIHGHYFREYDLSLRDLIKRAAANYGEEETKPDSSP